MEETRDEVPSQVACPRDRRRPVVSARASTGSTAGPSGGGTSAAPSHRRICLRRQVIGASPSAAAAAPTPEPAKDCAQSTDANAMQMWERSGGNKGMVDILVCAWNAANPDQADQPELHRPHRDGREDRPGHRLGRRPGPDGHGPDLRPAVRERRSARRHHRPDQGLAGAEDGEPGPHDRRDLQRPPATASRSTPTSRRCSTTRTCSRRPGSTRTSRRPASPRSATYADKITALGGDIKGYYLPGQLRRLQHLHRRPADVGVRRDDRGRQVRRRAARRRRRQAGRSSWRATWSRPATSPTAPEPRPAPRSPAVRLGQGRHDGHRQLQHLARARPDEGPPVRRSASACCRA